jgi:hypothetical protein
MVINIVLAMASIGQLNQNLLPSGINFEKIDAYKIQP